MRIATPTTQRRSSSASSCRDRCRAGITRWALAVMVGVMGGAAVSEAEQPAAAAPRVQSTLTLTTEGWQNARGGLATTAWWNALADGRVEIAGPELGTPQHSVFVAQVHAVANRSDDETFSERIGITGNVSGVMARNHLQIFNLHYRQEAAEGTWAFKVGQLAIDDDFMLSDYAGTFVNAAFGAMPSQVATPHAATLEARPAFPVYGGAAPGVWLRLQGSPAWSWQGAVYDGDPGVDRSGNHGFDWRRHTDGVVAFSEFDLQQSCGVTRLGVTAHTGRFDDLRAAAAASESMQRRGLWTAYVGQDWTVIAGVDEHPKLGAFARVGISPQTDRSVVDWYGDAGLNWFGPIGARPDDVVGLALSHTSFTGAFRAVNEVGSTENVIEATYLWRVSARFIIQPDLQWLTGAATNLAAKHHGSAVVIGVRTRLSF